MISSKNIKTKHLLKSSFYFLIFLLVIYSTFALASTPSFEIDTQPEPTVINTSVTPGTQDRGADVIIASKATDASGVKYVKAEIKNAASVSLATINLYDDGVHSDGAAGDDVYAIKWTIPPSFLAGNYKVFIIASDNLGNIYNGEEANFDVTVVASVLTTIDVAPINPTITVGGTQTFTASPKDQFGNPIVAAITWTSGTPATGIIDWTTGVFTAVAAGTTVITAADGAVSGSSTATVTAASVLTTIDVTPVNPSIIIGGTQTFTASPKDQFGNPIAAAITWTSGTPATGIIDWTTGVFTAVAAGTTVITAADGAVSGSSTATVATVPATVLIQSPLNGANYTWGDLIDFEGTILGGTPDYAYEWSSDEDLFISNERVFSSRNLSENTHTITLKVTDADSITYNDSINITVKDPTALTVHMMVPQIEYYKNFSYFYGTSTVSGGSGQYTHSWDLNPGGNISTDKIPLIFNVPWSIGSHVLTLTVTDGLTNTAQDSMTINVVENTTLFDIFPKDGEHFVVGQPITFFATQTVGFGIRNIKWTSDIDNDINFTDHIALTGVVASSSGFVKSNLSEGLHTITVRIEDGTYTPIIKTFRIQIIPVPSVCSEDWSCSYWSTCSGIGERIRACEDNNFCGTANNKPDEIESCTNPGSSFDWRNVVGIDYMTEIKNQGDCGACWAFATLGSVEAKYNIQNSDETLDINLSEQDLASCSYAGSCSGGINNMALQYLKDVGINNELCFPFQSLAGNDVACANKCLNWENNIWNIDEVTSWPNPAAGYIKDKLVNDGPLIVSYHAVDPIDPFDWGGWLPGTQSCDNDNDQNHAVVIVGYDDLSGYWIARNSWGNIWNGDGYFKVNYGECGIESAIDYPSKVLNP